MSDVIVATVQRILYPKTGFPENGGKTWGIVKTDIGNAKGKFPWAVKPNERVQLEGSWAQSKYSGQLEFNLVTARPYIPLDERDALHYACTRTPGLGEAAEQKIWDTFGANWRNFNPARLKGIRPSSLAAFSEVIGRMDIEKETTAAIAWLLGKGATIGMAESAYAKWKTETVAKVNANPYILADLDGYSFRDVDGHVSKGFGISDFDPRRIKACILYFIKRFTQEDTIAEWDELCQAVMNTINISATEIAETVKSMFADTTLVPLPEVSGIATAKDWTHETAIYSYIAS